MDTDTTTALAVSAPGTAGLEVHRDAAAPGTVLAAAPVVAGPAGADGRAGLAAVLVGVDPTSDCLPAVRWAWQHARAERRPLELVTVWEYPRVPPAVGGVPVQGFPTPAEQVGQLLAVGQGVLGRLV
ncbi:universal stress protein, partial [Kineococcus glutinatus]|uniref:universal stress protein n=1 Tax=Kineococcus glutinatus TaxID=1070872 RepID=UPI0031EA4C51